MLPGTYNPFSGEAIIILTQKGYGTAKGANETANLTLNYGTVGSGSAPVAGDLVIWHVWAFDTGASPINSLTGSGWSQSSVINPSSDAIYMRGYAKVLVAGDISSPPTAVTSPEQGAVGAWVAYTVTGKPVTTLTFAGEAGERGSGLSYVNAVSNVSLNMSSVDGPAFASTMLTGSDGSVNQGWTGATPDGSQSANDFGFTGVMDYTHYWKVYADSIVGDNITAVGGDNGAINTNSVFYVLVE
jgi:hypothetical protein